MHGLPWRVGLVRMRRARSLVVPGPEPPGAVGVVRARRCLKILRARFSPQHAGATAVSAAGLVLRPCAGQILCARYRELECLRVVAVAGGACEPQPLVEDDDGSGLTVRKGHCNILQHNRIVHRQRIVAVYFEGAHHADAAASGEDGAPIAQR
eukprot:scaffold66707_cov103-Phaeocystis_antarctica.AAC.2